ncbi:MAG: hypothetical protein JWO80_788 [Bryobacterales bacterium]|nr:hypothetical protein [Bryobacterales bacterium]
MVESYSGREERRSRRHGVLVIGAGQDRIPNSLQTRALADSIPGASYKEIDSGHIALFERADEFIRLAIRRPTGAPFAFASEPY